MEDQTYRLALDRAHAHALAHLDQLDTAPVSAKATVEQLRSQLDRPLTDIGIDPATIIDELVRDVAGGILGSTSGRFFGWVIGGSLPSALATEWLVSTWDQNSGIFACGPAMAVVEEIAGRWLKELFALPSDASFAMVTGCQMAHVTCLAAARHHVLAAQGWNVEKQGLMGSPPIHFISNTDRHGTMDRALKLVGMGTDCIVHLDVDENSRVKPESLERELEARKGEAMVVHLLAGEINTGAFDDFERLIPLAHRYNAWVHVDGAFGLWAQVSAKYRHLMKGAAAADSWATDGHKWLNVPYDSGFAFVRHPDSHTASMTHSESYLLHYEGARDQMHFNPEWSRRARGAATYAAIRELGKDGLEELVDRLCASATQLVHRIGCLDGARQVWDPIVNQGLVRFLDPRPGATEDDHARRTDEVIERIVADGEVFFRGVDWRGLRCMRISVSNWRTNALDVDRAVAAVAKALKEPVST
jgi:glutamate/tyrosine decarboxylase-like PLP-dependent enzyme